MKILKHFFLLLIILSLSGCFQSKKVNYNAVLHEKNLHGRETMPLIVIDPGHGNYDLGTHNNLCEEKELALTTSLYTKAELTKMGYRVVMTRSHDEFVTLKKRAQIANDLKCQVLISIHFNAAYNKQANGIEIFYPKEAKPWKQKRSKLLAQTILRKMIVNTHANSRGIKEANYCVIRETNMPAVLIECGFITNDDECHKMINPAYQKILAESIAQGIQEYFQL